jgi:hypothetical protein
MKVYYIINLMILILFHKYYYFFLGMKADQIGSDNTFTTSISIFFVRYGAGRILHRCGYECGFFGCRVWCGVGPVAERMQINIVG